MQGIQKYEQQLFYYFDIDSFIPQNHLLRKINKVIDLGFIKELTRPFYCQDNGRPSIDPELFFRIVLVGYLYGIESDRQLCDEIKFNLAYRWFCKLNLEDSVPNHSSLTKIRDRLGLDIFNKFFLQVVQCCKEAGLVKGERVMTDGTLFDANASLGSLESKDDNQSKNKEIIPNIPGVNPPTKRNIGNKTHVSNTDPDATLAFKNGTPRTLKYKAHITIDADSRVILDNRITTGAVHESQVYLEQLETIKQNFNLKIKYAIADRAYGSGEIIQSLLDKQVTPNIALFSSRSGMNSDPVGFVFDKEHNRYQCPANHYLTPCPTIFKNTVVYMAKTSTCKECDLNETCTAKIHDKRNKKRKLTRNTQADLFDNVKKWEKEKLFQQNLIERMWKMEGLISEAKNLHGLSRAKYRGLKKTQIQAYMVASALNLKRLAALLHLRFVAFKYFIIYCIRIFIQFNARTNLIARF